MRAVGIVAEYNPFHFGHLYQIRSVRAKYGQDTPIIAVMSGDFVQRGEAAAYDKFVRAEAAVRCGVSLVIELPLPWSLSSAEGFARGAVGLLGATGVTDTVSFGSESADADALQKAAAVLETAEFSDALKEELSGGTPFAAARARAAHRILGDAAAVLDTPNDLLAVEYIRASQSLGYTFNYYPVLRQGAEHDGPGSASELRAILRQNGSLHNLIPADAETAFFRAEAAGRGYVSPEDLRLPLMARLRERQPEDFASVPDGGEGLEYRLYDASRKGASPEEVAGLAKSKRYALSRMRRMVMCAALGVRRGDADGIPPYLRVLAFDEKGSALLHEMRTAASVPVIVKSAHIRDEDERAKYIFSLGSRAHDLYVLVRRNAAEQAADADYRATPFILKGE